VTTDWTTPDPLSDAGLVGQHARLLLQPLTHDHGEAFLAASRDHADEVFAHLSYRPPQNLDQVTKIIDRLNAPADQLPYAQIVAETGEFAGTTSFYEIYQPLRALAIGHTWISHRFWRSWLNTTSKLIMLDRAFDQLGAERVVWHTDIRNTRSQQAIARLGASKEGVFRHHRIRPDGSWRDTVQFAMIATEWPAAERRLISRASSQQ